MQKSLERLAGVSDARIVESHGSFATASCTLCNAVADPERTRALIMAGKMPKCAQCQIGFIKPDITFFG